jgi:hypothetical protein
MENFPSAKKLMRLAKLCTVTDQKSGKLVPFRLLEEQEKIVYQTCESQNVIFLKGRQIGCSTVICFLDAIFAILHPGSKVAVVADTEQKCHSLVDRVRDFLTGLGIKLLISNRSKIRLDNGSEIHSVTANASKGQEQSKAGRSMSFQMLHLSELAFWPDQDAFKALTASAGLSAPIIIESTSSGPGDLLWTLWNNSNTFEKVFFPVQDHSLYRSDPAFLTDENREQGAELGFTDEGAMAWFFRTLEDRFSGDLIGALREYPQRPEHAFQSSEGRWVRITPPILEHKTVRHIKIFRPRRQDRAYSVGIDTAGGLGRDSSTIAVIDRLDGSLCATYSDNLDTIDIFTDHVRSVYELYAPDYVCVETNGIGQATSQSCRDKGVPVRDFKTTDASRYTSLLLLKQAVEKNGLAGPEELALECDELHIDKRERFAGSKDLCMAIGFALDDAKRNPFMATKEDPTNVFKMSKFVSNKKEKW